MSCIKIKPIAYECANLDELETFILDLFDADRIVFEGVYLKEEIYFQPVKSFNVGIIGGVTETLNFKELSNDKYNRIENYVQIESELSKEAIPVVERIISQCEMSEFDQIAVIFSKQKHDGSLVYIFGSSHKL